MSVGDPRAHPAEPRVWQVAPALSIEVIAPPEVQALCAPHVFGIGARPDARVTFEESGAALGLPGGELAFAHPELRWPRDGTAFVEAALHAAALEVAWSRGGLLVHGAGLLSGSGALLALANSGGGKSTLTNLAHPRYPSLSDETLQIDLGGAVALAATSFRSDSPIAPVCRSAPLRALLLLEKSEQPLLTEVTPAAAASALLAQLYRPRRASAAELLHRASTVARGVAAYRFAFPKAPVAVELLDAVLRAGG